MGWKLNKTGDTFAAFWDELTPHLRRLLFWERGPSDIGHAFVNVHVEAARASAYQAGHIWAIQTFISIIGVIYYVLS